MQRALLMVAIGSLAPVLVGCTDLGEVEEEEVASIAEPLAGVSRNPLHGWWHGRDSWWQHPDAGNPGRFTIPVCWAHMNRTQSGASLRSHSLADSVTEASLIQALQATWQAQSGVVFDFRGDCPSNGPLTHDNLTTVMSDAQHSSWVSVVLIDDRTANGELVPGVASAGIGWPGFGNRNPAGAADGINNKTWWQIAISCGAKREDLPAATVHEFGHMLGWQHEWARGDYQPNYLGPNCVPPTSSDDPGTQPQLTPADADSIMALPNCSLMRHDDTGSQADPIELSNYDGVGLRAAYPSSLTRRARGRRGFMTSAGPVIRSDDALVTDWTAEGIRPAAYNRLPKWTYGSTTISTMQVTAEALGPGTRTVSFNFEDFVGRTHTGSQSVTVSNARHAALMVPLRVD
jgi:hypothetical protein